MGDSKSMRNDDSRFRGYQDHTQFNFWQHMAIVAEDRPATFGMCAEKARQKMHQLLLERQHAESGTSPWEHLELANKLSAGKAPSNLAVSFSSESASDKALKECDEPR